MDDPHAWLEDIEGDEALAWVRARNAEAESILFTDPLFARLRAEILDVLEADDRIAEPARHGDTILNFWTDAHHRRGILRRTTWDEYRRGDPAWETVLDIDALGVSEGESWVLHGVDVRRPDRRRALVDLSPGGSDASVTREFDLIEKRFVPEDEGGFVRPLAKGGCAWIDEDTVYVMTDTGSGSLTRSGYPRVVREWRRGTPLSEATVVFEGEESDISVWADVSTVPGHRHHLLRRGLDFYRSEHWLVRDGGPVRVPVPEDVDVDVHERWLTFRPRDPWPVGGTTHPGGSLLAATVDGFLAGTEEPVPVFTPDPHRALAGATWTRHHLVLNVLDDVRNRLSVATPPEAAGAPWEVEPLAGVPDVWVLSIRAVDSDERDDLWVTADDLLTPETLHRIPVEGPGEQLRQAPARFDTSGLSLHQHFATSADGTRVPYFAVAADDVGGPGPTLLSGYGGFEVPRQPGHAPVLGRSWLAAGGTYVLANIRGGGEYGPRWHQAGLRERRPRVYEDFEAVARDLIDRRVTTPHQLACAGGSNGGLLVGNMYVRSPELWGAVVCQAPLLDMKRYPHLLAGASWIAEYGDPDDPDDWAFISTFSPYHLVEADAAHPPLLLITSTRDDRVHPGHARKMAALLAGLGKDVTYWENIEGGHGGAADAAQQATMQALVHTFLRRRLLGEPAASAED